MAYATQIVVLVVLCTLVSVAYVYHLYRKLDKDTSISSALDMLPNDSGQLAKFFAVAAACCVVFSALILPPFQSPDETAHWRRAVHVAHHHLFAHQVDNSLGADLPEWVAQLEQPFVPLIGRPSQRATQQMFEAAWHIPYTKNRNTFQYFINTAIYPPTFYLPQSLAIAVGELLHMRPFTAYLAARITNGLTAVGIGTTAIYLAGSAGLGMFLLLCLPMTIHQMGSLSADATIIPTSLLVVAMACGVGFFQQRTRRHYFTCAALLALLAQARFPLIALMPLLWLPIWRRTTPAVTKRTMASTSFAVLACFVCWFGYVTSLHLPMRPDLVGCMHARMQFIFHAPVQYLNLFWQTLVLQWEGYLYSMIGVLGWLDTPIAAQAVALGKWALIFGTLHCACKPSCFAWKDRVLAALCVVGTFTAMQTAFFLSWSPKGSQVIEGFQGRYGLCFLSALLIAFNAPATHKYISNALFWSSMILSAGCLAHLPWTILARFYMAVSVSG